MITASFDKVFIVSLSMMNFPRACSYSCGLSCRYQYPFSNTGFCRGVTSQLLGSQAAAEAVPKAITYVLQNVV